MARVEKQTGKATRYQQGTKLTAASMEISYSYHNPLAMATVVACATNTLPPPYVTIIMWAKKPSLAPSISSKWPSTRRDFTGATIIFPTCTKIEWGAVYLCKCGGEGQCEDFHCIWKSKYLYLSIPIADHFSEPYYIEYWNLMNIKVYVPNERREWLHNHFLSDAWNNFPFSFVKLPIPLKEVYNHSDKVTTHYTMLVQKQTPLFC